MIYTRKMMERECDRRQYQQYQDERIERMDMRLGELKDKVYRIETQLDCLDERIPKDDIIRRKKIVNKALAAVKSAKEHGDMDTVVTLLDILRYIADLFGEEFSVTVEE